MRFVSEPAKEEVSFELEKKKGQWKIVKPQLPPHLSVGGAITALTAIGARDDDAGKSSLKKLKALE